MALHPFLSEHGLAYYHTDDNAPPLPLPPPYPEMTIAIGEAPASVAAGAPGAADAVLAYAARMNTAVDGLDNEIDNTIVSDADPDAVEKKADEMETIGLIPSLAAAWHKQVAGIRAFRSGKSPAQVQAANAYYRAWRLFSAAWRAFYEKIQHFSLTGQSPESAWDQIDSYETELRTYFKQYAAVTGMTPATPLPPTAAQIAADSATPNTITDSIGLVVKGAIAIAVAVAVVAVVNKIPSSSTPK